MAGERFIRVGSSDTRTAHEPASINGAHSNKVVVTFDAEVIQPNFAEAAFPRTASEEGAEVADHWPGGAAGSAPEVSTGKNESQ